MLVISRKSGEVVRVGDARIRVEIRGGVAKLSIDAPKNVRILREELVPLSDVELDEFADPKEGL